MAEAGGGVSLDEASDPGSGLGRRRVQGETVDVLPAESEVVLNLPVDGERNTPVK